MHVDQEERERFPAALAAAAAEPAVRALTDEDEEDEEDEEEPFSPSPSSAFFLAFGALPSSSSSSLWLPTRRGCVGGGAERSHRRMNCTAASCPSRP